jgi:hypothetical protein
MGILEASWTVEIEAPRERCFEIAADIEGAPGGKARSRASRW